MAEWNEKTEKLIRDLGDYIDDQMRDILDPKASTLGTSSRCAFRHASRGKGLLERAQAELGVAKDTLEQDLEKIIALAESNGSDAAAKLKKAAPVAKQLATELGLGVNNAEMGKMEMLKKLKQVKKKGIKYD